eukprot:Selendium_serpulae@DN6304_c1_g2_i8.p1
MSLIGGYESDGSENTDKPSHEDKSQKRIPLGSAPDTNRPQKKIKLPSAANLLDAKMDEPVSPPHHDTSSSSQIQKEPLKPGVMTMVPPQVFTKRTNINTEDTSDLFTASKKAPFEKKNP